MLFVEGSNNNQIQIREPDKFKEQNDQLLSLTIDYNIIKNVSK